MIAPTNSQMNPIIATRASNRVPLTFNNVVAPTIARPMRISPPWVSPNPRSAAR